MNATLRDRSRFSAKTDASGSASIPSHVAFDSNHLVELSDDDVASEIDPNRPHNQADDSNDDVSGALQSSIDALCSLTSVAWASRVIRYECGRADRVLLIVS